MKKFFAIICAAVLLLTGCAGNSQATSDEVEEEKILNTIKISVGEKTFSARLEDNPTARAFAEMLPLEIDMTELHGNEKYFYLDRDLPSDSVSVGQIHAGDLMLFGSNCLVLFYKDFPTSYSYTRLGKLENFSELDKILGAGNILIKFEE